MGARTRKAPAKKSTSKKTSKSRKLEVTTPEAPVLDQRRGEVSIGPIVSASDEQLAAEIASGQHDDYLFDIEHHAKRRNRVAVIGACASRRSPQG